MENNWRRLTKDSKEEDIILYYKCGASFHYADDYYLTMTSDYLRLQMTNKKDNIEYWLYEDGDKIMVFGLRYQDNRTNPYTEQKGMWQVLDLSYLGPWGELDVNNVSIEALKYLLKSVRQRLDEKEIVQFNSRLTRKTDRHTKYVPFYFFNLMKKMIWEITEQLELGREHYMWHMNRDKIPEDETYVSDRMIPVRFDLGVEAW